MNIRTDTAVAAVRGTEADFSYDNNTFTITVLNGVVDLTNPYGTTTVGAGQSASVTGVLDAPGAASNVPEGDLPDWQEGIEGDDDELDNLEKEQEDDDDDDDDEKTLKIDVDHDGTTKSLKIKFKKGN